MTAEDRARTRTVPKLSDRLDAPDTNAPVRQESGGSPIRHVELQIAMRDGVRLATTVFLPDSGNGPWPVLLERTPYGRLGPRPGEKQEGDSEPLMAADIALAFCRRGYAVAVQDCRGRYDSEGVFRKYSSEGNDSFDTIEALSAMEWCDGRVGTFGQSYSALVQTAVGPLAPRALVAQVIDSGGFANARRNGLLQNGVVEMKQAIWLVREAAQSPAALADPEMRKALLAEDLWHWLGRMPWTRGQSPLVAHPDYEQELLALFAASEESEDWHGPALAVEKHFNEYKRVPILFLCSWYDPYARSLSEIYTGLKGRQPCHVIMGPWTHGDHNNPVSGDVFFGPEACLDQLIGSWIDLRSEFLDSALRSREFSFPRALIFLMGGGDGTKTADGHLNHRGRWISASDWPIPGTHTETFHLRPGEALSGSLCEEARDVSFPQYPADPVPTIGGDYSSFAPYLQAGAFDQAQPEGWPQCQTPGQRLDERDDVCVFRTEPLPHDLAVAGPVDYEIEVSTDAVDTDIALKLIDEYPASASYPQGYAMLLGDTIVRLSHAAGGAQSVAGRVIRLKGTLCWTANRFVAGHRIRLDIASSNFPKFELNRRAGNTLESSDRQFVVNTLHLGTDTGGCRLHLPFLPEAIWT